MSSLKIKLDMLAHLPFFHGLSSEDLVAVSPLLYEKKYKKGSIIFFEKDKGEELYIIKAGLVKIYSFDGAKKVILAFFRDGDYFGEMALVGEGMVRSATAETLETTVVYVLKRTDFENMLEHNHKLTRTLLAYTMERLRKSNEQIQDLTFLSVRMRILKILLRLSKQHGIQTDEGMLIDLKLTHQQIADLVGAVRETVTKVLLELQEGNYITVEHKKIMIVNPEELERMLFDFGS